MHKILSLSFFLLFSAQMVLAIGIPTPQAPDAGELIDTTPTFQWTAVSGAERYRLNVQYQTPAGFYDYWFEEVIFGQNTLSYTTPSGQALQPGLNYRFTVRAEAGTTVGTWASQTFFHVPMEPVVSTAPTSGALQDPQPTFRWNAVTGAERYRLNVQYQTPAGHYDYWFEKVLTGHQNLAYTPTASEALDPGLNYRFTVRGETDHQVGPWGTQTFFHRPLGEPTPTDPDPGVLNTITPTFRWTAVDGATRYRLNVQYQTAAGHYDYWFEEVLSGQSALSYVTPAGQALEYGKNYRFTVRAESHHQVGEWANQTFFNLPLGLPSLQEPTAAILTETTPTFRWTSVTGAERYRLNVQYQTTSGSYDTWFEKVLNGQQTLSYTPVAAEALQPGLHYRFTVRAETSHQIGQWPTARHFDLALGLPTKEAPLTSTIDEPRPEFRWSTVDGADSYRFNLRNHSTNALHIEEVLFGHGTTTYRLPQHLALSAGESYRWTVRAELAGVTVGDWPSAHVFTYDPPNTLTAPQNLEPDAPTSDPTPHFTWDAVSGASHYEIEIYRNGQRVHHRTDLNQADYQILTSLELGDYTWRVQASNATATGPWSDLVSFSIESSDATDLRLGGLVVDEERPNLRLSNGGTLAQATLRRYCLDTQVTGCSTAGGLSTPLAVTLSDGERVLTPQADLVEHDVYAVTVGGADYVLTYDAAQYGAHINLVAFGAKPWSPANSVGQAFNNHTAFEVAIQALSQGGHNNTLFVPRGRWMVGRSASGQLGQIKPNPNMVLRGVDAQNTVLVAPATALGQRFWDRALIGDDTRRVDGVEVAHLTISGLYAEPSSPVPPDGTSMPYLVQNDAISLSGNQINLHHLGVRYVRFGLEIGEAPGAASLGGRITDSSLAYVHKGLHLVNTSGGHFQANHIVQVDTQGVLMVERANTINFNAKVIGNTVIAAQHRGLHLGELDGGLILHNTIKLGDSMYPANRMSAGILANGPRLIIMDNTIDGVDSGGVAAGRYQGIGGGGIKLENGPDEVLIAFNGISEAETDGITLSAKGSQVAIVENTISQSGQRGIRLRSGSYSIQGCPEIAPSPFPDNSTAISQIFIIENDISGTQGTYDLDNYSPVFPMPLPACPNLQSYAYNIINGDATTWPKDLGGHNVFEVGATSTWEPSFGGSDDSGGAATGAARDISIFQNPYYVDDSMIDADGAVVPDDVSDVFVAFLGNPSIMLDSHVSQVSFDAAAVATEGPKGRKESGASATIHRILGDGTIDSGYTPDFGQNRYPELVNLLVQLQGTWQTRFGHPNAGSLEEQSYQALATLITKYSAR